MLKEVTVFTGTGSEGEVLGGWPGWHILSPPLSRLSGDSTSLPSGGIPKQGQWSGCPPPPQPPNFVCNEWIRVNAFEWMPLKE